MRLRCFQLLAVLAALLVTGSFPATAQSGDDGEIRSKRGGFGYFAVGPVYASTGELNDQLSEAGYPTFSRTMLTLGGGGMGRVGERLLLGGEGYALTSASKAHRGRGVRLNGGYGFFNVGYLAIERGGLSAYPFLGFGGGGTTLSIETGPLESFDQMLAQPDRGVEASKEGLLVQAGVSGSLFLGGGDEQGVGGFLLGVQLGYAWDLSGDTWTVDDVELSGGPAAGIGGPYLRLRFGGGGFAGTGSGR